MARWTPGETVIERFLEQGHLEQVVTDADASLLLIETAERHVASARLLAPSDVEGAYALAYDGARKAATALLIHQGLRPTSAGGHVVVVEAMREQFAGVPGLSSLDRLRRRRNATEYPDPARHSQVTAEEVAEGIESASSACSSARKLLETGRLGLF